MLRRVALGFVAACLTVATAVSASKDRAWQTGMWYDVQIVRPRIVFGLSGRPVDGRPTSPFPPAMVEVRTYVIETDTLRLELREKTRADAPRLDAKVGERVTFAIEKNTVYIRMDDGDEHKISLTRRMARPEL